MRMIHDKNYFKLKQTCALSRFSIESFNFMGALQPEALETEWYESGNWTEQEIIYLQHN